MTDTVIAEAALSLGQERLWFLQQLQPDDAAYHIVVARRLRGILDVVALTAAATGLVARQESLRTRFPTRDGQPFQQVVAAEPVRLEHFDATATGDPERAVRDWIVGRVEAPFDLAEGPCVRWLLGRVGPDEHVLGLVLHHIVADGWSLDLICAELGARYRGEGVSDGLDRHYLDFARGQRAEQPRWGDQVAYWRGQLAGAAPLSLAGARPRPPVRTSNGAVVRHRLDASLCRRISRCARTHRVTLFMTVLAAFQAVLARHSGSPDICVGAPVAQRDREEWEPVVGFFVNTLALRADLSGDPTFAELLSRTRATALAAYQHADLPFDYLVSQLGVARDTSRTPVFQAMFRLDPAGELALDLGDLEVTPFELDHRAAQVDLALEVTLGDDGGWADLVYNTDLYDASTVAAVGRDLLALLSAATDRPADRLSLLGGPPPLDRPAPVPAGPPRQPVRPAAVEVEPAPDAVESALAEVWAELLGVAAVDPDDDFFDLGGHSLLAARAVALLRSRLPRPISVMDVFRYRTVRRLARLVDGGRPAGEVGLLHELTPPAPPGQQRLNLVCLPYGGGSAVVYQPLADALGQDCSLHAVAIPGHDLGDPSPPQPLDQVAQRCVDEILRLAPGPVVVYGHCGVGGALAVEISLRLREAGRPPIAVYLGATYPFARPPGRLMGALSRLARVEAWRGDRETTNWLTAMGADLGELDDAARASIVRSIRHDGRAAEDYYTARLAEHLERLDCPVISVVGEDDPVTDYAAERYREWSFLSERTALVVLRRAGHFFLKYRAAELAEILTSTHVALDRGTLRPVAHSDRRWWIAASSASDGRDTLGLGRFALVASSQLVSVAGTAITDFALPLWFYLQEGSVGLYAVLAALAIVPGILAAPVAGSVVDRSDRRRVMLTADLLGGAGVGMVALAYATGTLSTGLLFALVAWLSVALTFQRLAYTSAIPQLVPKRYLGSANGVVEMCTGAAQFVAPLVAVGLVASVGLGGILMINAATFLIGVAVVAAVRFPRTLPHRRREPVGVELIAGLRYSLQRPPFRAMLGYFAVQTLFLSPLLVAVNPTVLSFAGTGGVAAVAVAGGLGAALGGLTMVIWGGPARRRMRVVILGTAVQGLFGAVAGLRPSVALFALGLAGMLFCLAIVRGSYATIVHVKVPQRLQGRVFAVNQIISWSTIPIGFAVVTPLWAHLFGPGRGLALMYVCFGLVMTASSLLVLRFGRLSHVDVDLPDAIPDDLIGLREVSR